MTFDARETSRDGASWIEYLEFVRGAQIWRYTSERTDVTFQGNTYYAKPGIRRGPIEQSNEDVSMQLRITFPRTALLAAEFMGTPVPAPILVTLWRNHRGEADGEALPIWIGEVSVARFTGSELEMLCTTEEAALGGQLGRMLFTRTCANMLYDGLCAVPMVDHTFNASVSAVAGGGSVITVTGPGDLGSSPSHYVRGTLVAGGIPSLILAEDAPGEFTLQVALGDVAVSDTVQIRHGCDRTHAVCISLFDNGDRFQGYEMIPLRDVNRRLV
jgi:uncharacterized phage protein (TIGR02218 family)